jgi:Zn-dependent protease with chaperone function
MDFFAQQDRARRRTSMLLVYFLLAVVLIILAVYGAIWLILGGVGLKMGAAPRPFWVPDLFLGVTGGTLAVVALGTFYKLLELRAGGAVVARMLGGTPVARGAQDFHQQQLLNVVEEMAIAAGVPVPPVYVLEQESGINAFAAGHSPADAVVGVTRGCLERLTRDELQGVIAHEFSHILNGDMRLNLRLIGVLHGILVIALIGQILLRSLMVSGSRSSSRRGKDSGGKLLMVLLGVALIIIGYVGVFFARLIQSAVSREREYLADASAVQFTRNPTGLAGALKRIGTLSFGSRIDEPQAAEATHLFFGNAAGASWFGWLATHPPLTERIRRLDPSFDGRLEAPAAVAASEAAGLSVTAFAGAALTEGRAAGNAAVSAGGPARRVSWEPTTLLQQVGAPTEAHLDFAMRLRAALPAALTEAVCEPFGAQAVIFGLLLDASPTVRQAQMAVLKAAVPEATWGLVQRLQADLAALPVNYRMPVLELALPALQQQSVRQLAQFQDTVRRLAEADQEVSLFEYTLQCVLVHRIRSWQEPERQTRVEFYSLTPLAEDCRMLLSTLAYLGTGDMPAEHAFGRASATLGTIGARGLIPAEQCSLAAVDKALERLGRLSEPLKRRVLGACVDVVLADRQVDQDEAEMLRAVAAALDCPMPPLLAGPPPGPVRTAPGAG